MAGKKNDAGESIDIIEVQQGRFEVCIRVLIRSVEVKITTTDDRIISVPVYVRDPAVESDVQGYQALDDVKGNPDAARAALDVELMRVEGLLERAEAIAEVLGLLEQVQRLSKKTKSLRRLVQPSAQA